MKTNLPKRKPTRLNNYNYSSTGYYFVTLCTKDRKKTLSRIVGDGAHDIPRIQLTTIGKIVEKYIISSNKIEGITVDKYVIMPDHVHILIGVQNKGTSRAPSPTNEMIPHTISTLKRFVHKEIGESVFQRSYNDHIIRGEHDYQEVWQYIEDNPIKYELNQPQK